MERFVLGEHDLFERFRIPSRLYGREREQAALRAAAARVLAGARELVLVTGQPGAGKSALVRELAAPSTRGHAYFIEGKFDQYQRNLPYAALTSAFDRLVSQLLTAPEERLARWLEALRIALAPNAQVLVDIIPDLAFLLGPQPPVARLDLNETSTASTSCSSASWRWCAPPSTRCSSSSTTCSGPTPPACACAGNVVNTATLAILYENDLPAAHGHLLPAIELGLLRPLPAPEPRPGDDSAPAPGAGTYAFAHDRVQQAAYALIPADDRGRIHLRIARLLEQALPPGQREQRLFERAEHYVLAAALLDDPAEKLVVARLCLAAGQRARASMAGDAALRFLRAGLALMPVSAWQAHYELMRGLALATAEAEYLTDHFDAAERLSAELIAHARDDLDRAEVHDFQITCYFGRGRLAESVALIHEALAMLGVVLPREPAAGQALARWPRSAGWSSSTPGSRGARPRSWRAPSRPRPRARPRRR